MDHPIVGKAKLICDGRDRGEAIYRIEPAYNMQGMRYGVGTLVGDPASLYAALLAKNVTLERQSGRPSFGITVTDASMSSRQAAFMTAGTVFDP